MELPTLSNDPMPTAPAGTVRAVCVELEQPSSWEQWPTHFAFPPRAGDTVKAVSGKVARIANVMHIMGAEGFPVVVLELARNTGGSTAVESGGGALEE